MKKKCLIIGSGLGGLSCGYILAKNGYEITILEKNNQIGGCLQCFSRQGVKFETGMHFIGSADKGQALSYLLNYLDIDKDIQLNRLDTNSYDIVSLKGERFCFANKKEGFIEKMSSYFPKEKDNLERYYNLITQISQASSLHTLNYKESDNIINTKYQTQTINEVIDDIIKDKLLKSVLVGNLPLYAGVKDRTPFSTHAFIMDFYNKSSFRIIGGSDNIALSLANSIKELGGKVLTKKQVKKVICNDNKAIGLETQDKEFYQADIIISDIHPSSLMNMLDTKMVRPIFRNRINNIPNTVGGFSVYLMFKKDKVPYMNSNFYSFRDNTPWNCDIYNENTWPKGYLYMHFCHKKDPSFAQSGVILSYMTIDEMEPWLNTFIGNRGLDYQEFKETKAKKLLNEVEKDFPILKDNIEAFYTSTPLTYRDYTGTKDGSMYGVIKDVSLGASGRVHHRTKIPNLFLTGQNINSHGMLGVLIGTIVTCSALIGEQTIYNQLKEANNE